jgi:hypothetical protein
MISSKPTSGQESNLDAGSFANAPIVSVSSVLHRLLGRAGLLRRLRPGRLSENWDSGYSFGVRQLEGKLLREKSDAVASGFGVERVRCFIDLELLGLAHDLEVLLRQFAIQKRFVGCVL